MKNSEWMIEQKYDYSSLNANEDKGGERWRIYCYGTQIDSIKKEPYETSCYHAILRWLDEEHREPLLTEEEHDYLATVIKPWKNRISSICKRCGVEDGSAYICFFMVDGAIAYLPNFYDKELYKNLEFTTLYSLDDLDL